MKAGNSLEGNIFVTRYTVSVISIAQKVMFDAKDGRNLKSFGPDSESELKMFEQKAEKLEGNEGVA